MILSGETSDWAPVLAGVHQGSILGPLLFLLYINDIFRYSGGSIRIFADGTSLYIIVDCPTQSASLLNADLRTISYWADAWLVTFNANKTLSMVFTWKQNPLVHPPLYMNNTMIKETKIHKHFGLTFSNTCNWAEYVTSISGKAWARLYLLRTLKFRVSRKSLEKNVYSIHTSSS